MKKSEQKVINSIVEKELENFETEVDEQIGLKGWHKFRSCSAEYAETETYYVLCSYNTIVAIVNKKNGRCIDFLRKVYGDTATSAQHISKFFSEFGHGKWRSENEIYVWREV